MVEWYNFKINIKIHSEKLGERDVLGLQTRKEARRMKASLYMNPEAHDRGASESKILKVLGVKFSPFIVVLGRHRDKYGHSCRQLVTWWTA